MYRMRTSKAMYVACKCVDCLVDFDSPWGHYRIMLTLNIIFDNVVIRQLVKPPKRKSTKVTFAGQADAD